MKKICYVVLHSEDTTAGTTDTWLKNHSIDFKILTASTLATWPTLVTGDSVIVLGGDMEVWETEKYPWLLNEKDFLKRAFSLNVPVFGVCLGSQLLAETLGASVKNTNRWEVGWHEISLEIKPDSEGETPTGSKNSTGKNLTPFHCHSSAFELPPGARRLASSSETPNQGFELDRIYVGFQFHTEIDESRLQKIYAEWDSTRIGNVDSLELTKIKSESYIEPLNQFYFSSLDRWYSASHEKFVDSQLILK